MEQELRMVQSLDIEGRLKEIKSSLGVIEWYVKVVLILEYHHLRMQQKAVAMISWTAADTAVELGLSKSGVSEDIRLAKLLKERPEIKELSKTVALELIRK